MVYQGGGERRQKRIEYWIFAGGQSWLTARASVVCRWERALVGEGRRSEGRDAREAQIPNNQMWHHKNVIILSHVHQLRMSTKTRPQS